jgi:hypothetical protein
VYLAEILEETSRRLASEHLESADSVLPSIAAPRHRWKFHPIPGERNRKNDTLIPTSARIATATATASADRCHSLAVVAQSLSLPPKAFIPSLCLRVWECGASGCVLHLPFFFSNAHSSPRISQHGSIQRRLARHERCFKRQRSRRVEASQQAIQNRATKGHRQKEKARPQSPPANPNHLKYSGHNTNLLPRRHTVRMSRREGTRSSHWAHPTSPNIVKNSQGSVDFLSTSSTSVLSRAQPSLIPRQQHY